MNTQFRSRKFRCFIHVFTLIAVGVVFLVSEITGGAQAAVRAFGGSAKTDVNLGVAASGSSRTSQEKFLLRKPKNVERRDMFNKPTEPASDGNDDIDVPDPVVPVRIPLSINPLTVPLASGGQQVFTASGGLLPYTFSVVADTTGGATVNATTGFFTAGQTVGISRVRVTDANLDSVEAGVTVVAFGITPAIAVLTSGAQQVFAGISGTPPYTFSLVSDTTGGATVNASTGLYSAGTTAGTSTVRVTDSTLETMDAGITVQTPATILNQSPWSVQSVSSQLSSTRGAAQAIDGNPNTNWTTLQSASVSPPHNLEVNLGNVYEIEGFKFLPRLPTQGIMTSFYEFYVSEDGQNWGEPVAAGEFAKFFAEKEVSFPRVAGRYVRIRPLGEHNGRNFIILAELNVVGAPFSGNFAPNGTINTPSSNLTISAGSSLSFSGTFTDSNGDSASAYLWDFGDPTIPDSTEEDPGSVVFPNPGTYTVTYTVTDSFGLADPYPASVTVKVGANTTLPRANWSIKYVNSEEVNQANRVAENVLDGNTSTIWQTQFTDVGRPHEIQLDLGSAYRLDAFRYLPPGGTGRILSYHIYVSPDGVEWGAPVAIGSFVNSSAEQRVAFPPKTGQFVRLVALTTVNNNPTAAMAEVNLEGQCDTPFVALTEPVSKDVQAGPGLRVTASVCLVQPVHAGWGVRLSVDGGQQQTIPFPSNGQITPTTFQRTFTGVSGDNHQVTAVIVNAGGNAVGGADTSDTVTQVGIGDVYAGIGDSTTVGVADDNDTDATSQDGRNTNTGRGFIPSLNNILTTKLGRPHDILNYGYSGESSAGALIRTPKVLRERPRDTVFLIALGINDAFSGMVPSGEGTSNPGPGTFKANLQELIDLLHAPSQGRRVALAKVSFLTSQFQPSSTINDLTAYNRAIDELVASNGLTVGPPDLFTHFQTNPQDLAGDGIHPSGQGYKSISTLWCVALTGGSCPAP